MSYYPNEKKAREEWLSSRDPKQFAVAATICPNLSGDCLFHGFCHYGDCFPDRWDKLLREIQELENE